MNRPKSPLNQAAEDIHLIRTILEKTRQSFYEGSSFFLWTGVLFLIPFIRGILQPLGVAVIGPSGRVLAAVSYISQFFTLLEWIGLIVIYLIFQRRIRSAGEELAQKLCAVWGFLLIGGQVAAALLSLAIRFHFTGDMNGSTAFLTVLIPMLTRSVLLAAGLFASGALLDRTLWKVMGVVYILVTALLTLLSPFALELSFHDAFSTSLSPAATLLNLLPSLALLSLWLSLKRGR